MFGLDGSAVCNEGQTQTAVGCASLNITNQAQCNDPSKRWWKFATTAGECSFVVCQENYNGNSFNTWKTPAECSGSCGGTSVDVLSWKQVSLTHSGCKSMSNDWLLGPVVTGHYRAINLVAASIFLGQFNWSNFRFYFVQSSNQQRHRQQISIRLYHRSTLSLRLARPSSQ